MKEIQLTKGKVAIVDDADYEWLSQWKWYARKSRKSFYAERTVGSHLNGNKESIQMHRVVLGITDPKVQGDHEDGDGLNNQRHNLRECTNTQNQYNKPPRGATSKYKGVWFDLSRKKWASAISHNNTRVVLGRFDTEQSAALAYNEAALKYHGDFAWLNQITD